MLTWRYLGAGLLVLSGLACGDDETSTTGDSGPGGAATTSAGGATSTGGGGVGGSGGQVSTGFPPPELGAWTGADPPVMTPSAAMPGSLDPNLAATHFGELACGPFAETVFDLIVPDGAGPHPLVLHIHGGGFLGGSRLATFNGQGAPVAEAYINAGMAFATIDYRLLFSLGEGVRTALQDSQVCLQYIRHHASTLGIDPNRVVLTGGSAGAGTSIWLATHDDLADPSSAHVILQESTRVDGIIIDATQATYDVFRWPTDVFDPEYGNLVQSAFDSGSFDGQLIAFYGAPDVPSILNDPFYIAYRQEADMLAHLTSDDPPIWARTTNPDNAPTNIDALYHHPFHVRALQTAAAAVSVSVDAEVPALGLSATQTRLEFAATALAP